MLQIIEVENVSKLYSAKSKHAVQALTDFSLSVEEGTVFGLLGPNGAGKTTLVKALLGMISVNDGKMQILGKSVNDVAVHSEIGYLPENHRFPQFMKGIEALRLLGGLSGLAPVELEEKIKFYLKKFQLEAAAGRKIKTYSKGMMQRLGLIQAVLHNPKVIFLDEPTDGVDPIGRKAIRDFISELKKEGKTIFINSHLLSEVEMICDRVAIMNRGRLVKVGTVSDLLREENSFYVIIEDEDNLLYSIPQLNEFDMKIEENKITLKNGDYETLNKLIDILRSNGIIVKGSGENKVSLEEFFIETIDDKEGSDE